MKNYFIVLLSFFALQSFAQQGLPTYLEEARRLRALGYQVAEDEAHRVNDTMQVLSVTYGINCGAYEGNITPALNHCNGFEVCNYEFSAFKFPAAEAFQPNCMKDLFIRYRCAKDPFERQVYRYPEANKKMIYLTCRNEGHPRLHYFPPLSGPTHGRRK